MSNFYLELEEARKACNKKQREFALSMASGLTELGAFYEVYGDKNPTHARNRAKALLAGPAGRYYGLLMSPMNERIIAPYALKREERLNLLSMGAVLAYNVANNEKDAKAINPMVRCVAELNRMTGEHAPDQLEIKGRVLHAAIHSSMTSEEATELYKQALQGARLDLGYEEKEAEALEYVEYEPIIIDSAGDSG